MGIASTTNIPIDQRFQNKVKWIKKSNPALVLIEVGLVRKQPSQLKPGRPATKKVWIERRVTVDEQGKKKLYVTFNNCKIHQTLVFEFLLQ